MSSTKKPTHKSLSIMGLVYDEFLVDVLIKPPGPGETFEQKEPGTRHYYLNGVEVFRTTNADALRLMEDGWVERPTTREEK